MEELIKYFESLEARISALEQTQAQLAEKLAANEAKLATNDEKVVSLGEKLRAVGGHISQMMTIMQDMKNQQPVAATPVAAPVVEPDAEPEIPVVPETPKEPIVEPTPEIPEVPEVPEEPVVEEPKPQELFIEPEPVKEVPVKETPVAAEESGSSKAMIYGKPVSDIRQAISLGDRFLYQRELFGQNAELMQKTLNDLDGLRSFDEAISYIMTHFKWDSESSTYQQFLVTLHRRFG